MSRPGEPVGFGCARARAYLHRRLDGDALDAAAEASLAEHVSACATCRQATDELEALTRALRALPAIPLPEPALQEVRRQTIEARRRGGWFDWRAAAAAAVLTAALGGLLQVWREPQVSAVDVAAQPTPAELARAAAEARFVLGLTARALNKSERVAVDEVLGQHVAPALSKVPIEWSEPSRARSRRGGRDA
jgi:predicted anti-sigma-YlaC factor YlaD